MRRCENPIGRVQETPTLAQATMAVKRTAIQGGRVALYESGSARQGLTCPSHWVDTPLTNSPAGRLVSPSAREPSKRHPIFMLISNG